MRNAFGVLGIIALFVAIVVGMFAAFGAVGAKAPQEGPSLVGLEATNQEFRQSAAAIDEPVTAGDVSWTVTDASQETVLHTFTFPPEEVPGSYVSIEFTVENVADRPVTLTGDTVRLYDDSGIEYSPEPDRNSPYVRPELNVLFNEFSLLQPYESTEGKVNFEVLPGSSDFVALFKGTDPTISEGEYVDLGF